METELPDYGVADSGIDGQVGMDYEGAIDFDKLSAPMQDTIRKCPIFCEAAGINITIHPREAVVEDRKRERASSGQSVPSGSDARNDKRAKTFEKNEDLVVEPPVVKCEV